MKRWLKLFLFVMGIWVFMEVAPGMMRSIVVYQKIQENSAKMGIDNSAVFYTEEPMSYKAEKAMFETLKEIDQQP
jgi:hypothetical protein